MKQSNQDRQRAAIAHLKLCGVQRHRLARLDAMYVKLAFEYGIPVAQIAAAAELDQPRVRLLLLSQLV